MSAKLPRRPSRLALALLALPALLGADGGSRLEGQLVERDPTADQHAIDQGIERVVAEFPSLIRPLVRHYLGGVTGHCPEPGIAWDGPTLIYSCRGEELIRHVPDGVPFVWQIPDSDDTTTVRLEMPSPTTLSMSFSNDLGGRTQTFALQPDGTVTERIVYHSDKLPVPLEYTLVFERKAP